MHNVNFIWSGYQGMTMNIFKNLIFDKITIKLMLQRTMDRRQDFYQAVCDVNCKTIII